MKQDICCTFDKNIIDVYNAYLQVIQQDFDVYAIPRCYHTITFSLDSSAAHRIGNGYCTIRLIPLGGQTAVDTQYDTASADSPYADHCRDLTARAEAVLGAFATPADLDAAQFLQYENRVFSLDDPRCADAPRDVPVAEFAADDMLEPEALTPETFCTACGAEMTPGARFCIRCGKPYTKTSSDACIHCGAAWMTGAKFCIKCGKPYEQSPAKPCPFCGADMATDARFCSACGKSPMPLCSACGAELSPGARFCIKCGKPQGSGDFPAAPAKPVCIRCGAELSPGARFCIKCGEKQE